MPEPLTPRQRLILTVMRDYFLKHGYAPTLREVGDAVRLASPSSVAHQIKVIKAKGWIEPVPGSRSLTFLDPEQPTGDSMSETERRTFRMAMIVALNEIGVDEAPALATALAHAIGPSFDRLVSARLAGAAAEFDAAVTGRS